MRSGSVVLLVLLAASEVLGGAKRSLEDEDHVMGMDMMGEHREHLTAKRPRARAQTHHHRQDNPRHTIHPMEIMLQAFSRLPPWLRQLFIDIGAVADTRNLTTTTLQSQLGEAFATCFPWKALLQGQPEAYSRYLAGLDQSYFAPIGHILLNITDSTDYTSLAVYILDQLFRMDRDNGKFVEVIRKVLPHQLILKAIPADGINTLADLQLQLKHVQTTDLAPQL